MTSRRRGQRLLRPQGVFTHANELHVGSSWERLVAHTYVCALPWRMCSLADDDD